VRSFPYAVRKRVAPPGDRQGQWTHTAGSSSTTSCPRWVRCGSATTPLIEKVIGAIKADVSAATAESFRIAILGVMSLAVRYGAITVNPVREVAGSSRGHGESPGH
jgi:hypothetical protein